MLSGYRREFLRHPDTGGRDGGGPGGSSYDNAPDMDPLLKRIYDREVTAESLADELIKELYDGVANYCQIPEGYLGKSLDAVKIDVDVCKLTGDQVTALNKVSEGRIVNPSTKQLQAIALFRAITEEDPRFVDATAMIPSMSPMVGAYLLGLPGCGKTHIMAAFASTMKKQLDKSIGEFHGFVTRVLKSKLNEFLSDTEKDAQSIGKKSNVLDLNDLVDANGNLDLSKDTLSAGTDHASVIKEKIEEVRGYLRTNQARPTAILFVEFDTFYEDYSRAASPEAAQALIDRICEADMIFVDDMHPKGDAKRSQLIQHFFERRYHTGKFGTFVTSNLEIGELTNPITQPSRQIPPSENETPASAISKTDMLNARLGSRAAGMIVTIDVDDAIDWRQSVHRKRMANLENILEKELGPKLGEAVNHAAGLTLADLLKTNVQADGFLDAEAA